MASWRVCILSWLVVGSVAFAPILQPVRVGIPDSQPALQSILARTSTLRLCEELPPTEQRSQSPEPEEGPGFIILAIAVFAISYLIGDSSALMPVDKLF